MGRCRSDESHVVSKFGLAVVLIAAAAVAGCDNAVESLDVGEWKQTGIAAPPVVAENDDVLTQQIEAGNGEPVQAGDLVKLSVVVLTPQIPSQFVLPVLSTEPRTIWVWTGRDEGDRWQAGYLGTAAARRALIGRQVGERFELTREPTARGAFVLPVNGLIAPLSTDERLIQPKWAIEGRYYSARQWRQLDLEPDGYKPVRAEIEILAVCRNAQRLHRTGVLKQWGYRLVGRDNESREGVLHWGAIEASCPDPDGQVRIQAGPFYFPDYKSAKRLLLWQLSYARQRPPPENLEEWDVTDPTLP